MDEARKRIQQATGSGLHSAAMASALSHRQEDPSIARPGAVEPIVLSVPTASLVPLAAVVSDEATRPGSVPTVSFAMDCSLESDSKEGIPKHSPIDLLYGVGALLCRGTELNPLFDTPFTTPIADVAVCLALNFRGSLARGATHMPQRKLSARGIAREAAERMLQEARSVLQFQVPGLHG